MKTKIIVALVLLMTITGIVFGRETAYLRETWRTEWISGCPSRAPPPHSTRPRRASPGSLITGRSTERG